VRIGLAPDHVGFEHQELLKARVFRQEPLTYAVVCERDAR
jgi:hypothetical protein